MKRKHVLIILFTLIGWTLSSTLFAQSDGTATVIRAGNVYVSGGEVLQPGVVLVERGKITAVGSDLPVNDSPQTIDLGPDGVLMAGFVNAYSQAGLGENDNEITAEVTPSFRAVESINWDAPELKRNLAGGTTTVCIAPGTDNVLSGMAAVVKPAAESTDRVLVSEGALLASLCSDPANRNQARQRPDSIYVRQPTNRMGVVWILRSTFDRAGRTKDANLEPIREAVGGKRTLMFVSRLEHDLNSVKTLADEFGFPYVLVGAQEAYKQADALAKNQIPLVLGSLTTGGMRGTEQTELCWNQAGILAKAGVTFSLSGENLLQQAQFAHRFGLDAETALNAITSTPAKLLGVDDRVGSIAIGKDADLVALSGDPLEFTSRVSWVMVNGKIVTGKSQTQINAKSK